MERWLPVPGFETSFEISDHGRIRTVERLVWFTSKRGNRAQRRKRVKLISTPVGNHGYCMAYLSADGKRLATTVHALVAETFLGPRPSGHDVCHFNGCKTDNRLTNLRYDTRANNHADKKRHGTDFHSRPGGAAKLRKEFIPAIRALEFFCSAKSVAGLLGVKPSTIRRVWRREAWQHC